MTKNTESIISKVRLETFTDAVFAIVLTLIVIEFHVPQLLQQTSSAELGHKLIHLIPTFGAWLISFAVICLIWLHHHRLFKMIEVVDVPMFWMNAVLLLFVSLIPFPAELLGQYDTNALALTLFGVVLLGNSILFSVLRLYLQKHPNRLIEGTDIKLFRTQTRDSILFGIVPYCVGIALAWFAPIVAFAIYFVTVFYRTLLIHSEY